MKILRSRYSLLEYWNSLITILFQIPICATFMHVTFDQFTRTHYIFLLRGHKVCIRTFTDVKSNVSNLWTFMAIFYYILIIRNIRKEHIPIFNIFPRNLPEKIVTTRMNAAVLMELSPKKRYIFNNNIASINKVLCSLFQNIKFIMLDNAYLSNPARLANRWSLSRRNI